MQERLIREMVKLRGGPTRLKILRKEYDEPRVHFAMVCASRGCPHLRSEAYRATHLEEQLDDQACRFVNDPSKNRYVSESRTLELSSIFKPLQQNLWVRWSRIDKKELYYSMLRPPWLGGM